MSLFNAFGQGGFASLAQTLENIGNIVAPIAPEDEEHRLHNRHEQNPPDDDEEDEEETFDDKIQGFFSNLRDNLAREKAPVQELEPSSPGSFVSVELSDDSSHAGESQGRRNARTSKLASTISSALGMVSGVELEKKVQQKYREQLEEGIEYNERKYAELQQTSDAKISMLEKEVKEWKALAESTSFGSQVGSDQEREEEMNTLYEKLGSLTAELEQREDDLSVAREQIAELEARVSSAVPTSAPDAASDSALVIQELETLLEAQKRETAELQEQLEEARDLQLQAEEREQRLRAEASGSDEQLTALIHQLRTANMTIAALEERVTGLQQHSAQPQAAADGSSAQQEAARAELTTLAGRLTELEEQLAAKESALQEAESNNAGLTQDVSYLTAQLEQTASDRANIEAEKEAVAARLQQLETVLAGSEAQVADLSSKLAAQAQQQGTASNEDLERQLWEQYEQTVVDLRSQLSSQVAAVDAVQIELERSQAALSTAGAQRQEQLLAHEQAMASLQAQLAEQQALLHMATSERKELSAQHEMVVADLTTQLAERTDECTALRGRLEDQVAALSEADRKYQALSSEHEGVLLRLNEQLTVAQKEQQDAQQLEAACATAEHERQRLSDALHSSQERVETLVAKVRELEEKLLVQEQAVAAVETRSSKQPGDDMASLPSPTAPPVLTPTADSEALAALQGEHNKALKKLKLLTRQLKEKDAEIARLSGEVGQRCATSEAVGATSASADGATVATLRAQLAAGGEELAALQAQHAAALNELKAQSESWAEELRTALADAQAREQALDAELAGCRAALTTAEDEAVSFQTKLVAAQAALQQERAAHHDAVAARDSVLAQLVEVTTEARRALHLEGFDHASSEQGVQVESNAATAVKTIKLMCELLNGRDKERSELMARHQASDADLAALRGQVQDLARSLDEARTANSSKNSDAALLSNELRSELDTVRASLASSESDCHRLAEELTGLRGQLDVAQQKDQDAQQLIAKHVAEVEELRSALQRSAGEVRAAQDQASFLQNALQESEASLKDTEEVAWKCKAEASELLFAYEQEQSKVVAAVKAREELAEKLARCQRELEQLRAQHETAAAESKVADVSAIAEHLVALHGFVSQATTTLDLIRGNNGATPVASEGGSFEQLLAKAPVDLVDPLVFLSRGAEVAANLATEAVVAFRDVSARNEALKFENEGLRGDLKSAHERLETATADAIRLSAALSTAETTLSSAQAQWGAERQELQRQVQQHTGQVAEQQAELQGLRGQWDTLTQRAQEEKQQLIAALNAAQATAAQGADQLQPLRAQVQKLDTENKQLHQVIAQLRQARKTSKGESDNAVAERDELRTQCAALQTELATLQDMLRSYRAMEATAAQLQADVSTLTTSLAASERNLEAARRALALREKECYDKDAELEVTRSDILIARQELDRRLTEVRNLQEAVSQVESEKTFAISRFQRDLAEKIDACKRACDAERAQVVAQLQAQLDEERERRAKAEGSAQDHELFYRKAEMEFAKEKRKMQQTVENALLQLNNSESQVIDRMLVANLIVSYFKRRRSTEVLKLIAKVLAFDDEQLIAVGLKVPPIDLLGTLLTTVMGRPAPPPPVEGDNLAEQWINFLINESDQDAGNSAGLVPRGRSGSNTSTPKSSPKNLPAGVSVAGKDGGEASSVGSGKQF